MISKLKGEQIVMMVLSKAKRKIDFDYIFIFLFTLLYFSVILQTGYCGDDAINSCIRGSIYSGEFSNIAQLTKRVMWHWIDYGRLYPLAFYVYVLFARIHTLVGYKMLLLLFIGINNLLFGYFTYTIWKSSELTKLGMLLYPMFVPLLIAHDSAYIAYNGLVEIVFAELIIAMILWERYLIYNKCWQISAACLVYFLSLMTYEVSYPYIILFMLIGNLYETEIKQVCEKIRPVFVTWLIAVLLQILVRINTTNAQYDGVTVSLNMQLVFTSFLKQLYALIPFNEYAYRNIFSSVHLFDLALILLFGVILYKIYLCSTEQLVQNIKRQSLNILGIGMNLLLWPLIMVSISAKYQHLPWGAGYLLNYISTFGVVMLFLYMLRSFNFQRRKLFAGFFLAFSLTIIVVQVNARTSLMGRNKAEGYYQRNAITEGIKSGILNTVKEDDIIITTSSFRFDADIPKMFYSCYARRKINAVSFQAFQRNSNLKIKNKIYISTLANKDMGCIIIGDGDKTMPSNINSIYSNNTYMTIVSGDVKGCVYKIKNGENEELRTKYISDNGQKRVLLGDNVKLKSVEPILNVRKDWSD